jgi:small GTP-binding protein
MRTIQKKICLLGDFAVGKTSLIRRYVEGIFDDTYLTTVGVVVTRKALTYPDISLNLLIWDLAGGRDFSQSGYLIGVAGAFIVCDLTRATTLTAYHTYSSQVRQLNPNAELILLANKSDLIDARIVSDERLWAMAGELGAPLLFTSAKTGEHVEAAFSCLADSLITRLSQESSTHRP